MSVFLVIPGSPVPDWLVFVIPLLLLAGIIKGSQLLYHWMQNRFFHRPEETLHHNVEAE